MIGRAGRSTRRLCVRGIQYRVATQPSPPPLSKAAPLSPRFIFVFLYDYFPRSSILISIDDSPSSSLLVDSRFLEKMTDSSLVFFLNLFLTKP